MRGVKKKVYDGMPVEKGLDGALILDMETICRDGRCDTIVPRGLVMLITVTVVAGVQERYCVRVEVAFFPNQTARDLPGEGLETKFINLEWVSKTRLFANHTGKKDLSQDDCQERTGLYALQEDPALWSEGFKLRRLKLLYVLIAAK